MVRAPAIRVKVWHVPQVVCLAPTLRVMSASSAKAAETKAIARLTPGRGALHVLVREIAAVRVPSSRLLPRSCAFFHRAFHVEVVPALH